MKKLCLISLVIALVIALVGGLILTSCDGNGEEPQCEQVYDVVVRIKELIINCDGSDWFDANADPYVSVGLGCVDPKTGRASYRTGRTKTQDDVKSGDPATDLQSWHLIFKDQEFSGQAVSHLIQFSVYDDNSWITGDKRILFSRNQQLVLAHPYPTKQSFSSEMDFPDPDCVLKIEVEYKESCDGEEDTTEGKVRVIDRGGGSAINPEENVSFSIAIDINETNSPSNVTVIETIPPEFEFIESDPPATLLSTTTDEGLTLLALQWVFTGDDVTDLTLSYTLMAPSVSGTYFLAGSVYVDGINVGIPGTPFVAIPPAAPIGFLGVLDYAVVGQPISFAACVIDPDGGSITSCEWDFGDGTPTVTQTESITTHTYMTEGTYEVSLTVTDNDGLTTTFTIELTVTPTPPPAQDEITIGAARSLSGPLELIGDYAFGPVLDYWKYEVNAAGGINVAGKYLPVEVNIQDDNSQMSVMTSLLTTMVTSGDYDFVFAPVSTAHLQAAAAICNANEYILMGAEGGCTSIMDTLDELPYLFGVLNFANHNQMEELFKLLDDFQTNQGAPDPMDIYVIYSDDLDGLEYRDEFAAEAANYTGQFNIVTEVAVAPFAVDVSAQLIEADVLNVDVFCAFTYPTTTMAVVDQAITNNINFDAMVLSWEANFQYFYDTFGAATEGIIGFGAWNEDTSASAAAFAADMIDRHGRAYMDWWGQLYYHAGLQCFQQAIERAGTLDQSVIRDVLATEHFTTVLGDTWFEDANGNHPIAEGGGLLAVECHPGQIGQWQNGIFEVIDLGPNNTATGIYPKPDWPE